MDACCEFVSTGCYLPTDTDISYLRLAHKLPSLMSILGENRAEPLQLDGFQN